MLLALCGTVRSVTAAVAHKLYFDAKYGAAREDPEGILRRCESAYRLYPHNYHLCAWAVETAHAGRRAAEADALEAFLSAEATWCERGLTLNPYKSGLVMRHAHLVALESPAKGAVLWERYVDWHFWEPWNHFVLVRLYARAGWFDKATASLAWLEGSKYYGQAAGSIKKAWRREMDFTAAP